MFATPLVLTTIFLAGVATPAPEPKPKPFVPQWTNDLAKMKLVQTPVAGKVFGVDFNLETIELQKTSVLILKDGPNVIFIFLPGKIEQGLEGKSWEFPAVPGAGQATPDVHVHVHRPITKAQAFGQGCAIKLEFGKARDNLLPGKLYICLPDGDKSFFAGSFTVQLP